MLDSQNLLSLNKQALGLLVGLSLQYLLGITTNLFVTFPLTATTGQLWQFAFHQVPLVLHIILGIGIFVGAVFLAIRSSKERQKSWIIFSGVGLLAIIIALVTGMLFIPTQQNVYSLLMAIGFLVAFFTYSFGIYSAR